MAHSLQNITSRNIVFSKLILALKSANVEDGILVTWLDDFSDFRKETLKSVGKWVGDDDIAHITYRSFCECVTPNEEVKSSYKLCEIVDASKLDEIASKVLIELESLPANYGFYFSTPKMSTYAEISLSSQIKFPAALSLPSTKYRLPKPSDGMVVVEGSGYASYSRQQSATRDAISKLKVAFRLAQIYGIFVKANDMSRVEMADRMKDGDPAIIVIKNNERKEIRIPMAINLSRYLNDICINSNYSSDDKTKWFDYMRKVLHVMYHKHAEKNVQSIRRALEWSFDAIIDEDETTRFMKTCIGLEAALTDQVEGMGITEQLADRCAFLLNTTTQAREETRKRMRKIYQLRSKIVHGVVLGPTFEDSKISAEADGMLVNILTLEIKGVMTWWQDEVRKNPTLEILSV